MAKVTHFVLQCSREPFYAVLVDLLINTHFGRQKISLDEFPFGSVFPE